MNCSKNILSSQSNFECADVMKLVDMLDLGSSASRRVGSSPSIRTILIEECYLTNTLSPQFYCRWKLRRN